MPVDSALVSEIRRKLGPGLKIVILADAGSEAEELAKQVALQLQGAFHQAIFITGALPGVQESFAKSCNPSTTKVYKLTPGSCTLNGHTVKAGTTLREVQSVLACIGDVYITFAGDQEVAEQAGIAFSRGAAVVPVIRTGGASSGKFGFPAAALKKPAFLGKENWSFISSTEASDVATAAAIAAAVAGYARGQSRCEASSLMTRREQERMERMAASMMSWKAPPWLSPYMQKISPALELSGHFISVVGPPVCGFYAGLYNGYKALPREAATCLWGIGQCFFGGTYAAFFAAAEAFKTSGGDQVLVSLQDLQDDAIAVLEANSEQEKELGHSTAGDKVKIVLRTVDPERISVAVRCIWAGCMGIVMALKYKFARTVAFAHSIGDNLRPIAAKVLAPSALAVTPPEYRQWIEPAINLSCKVVATALAWRLQQTISSVQSGIAGGMIASRSACAYLLPILKRRNLLLDFAEDSMLDDLLGWGLAATGIYFQVFCGGTPPLVLLPVTLPMEIAESWLKWSVTWLGSEQI